MKTLTIIFLTVFAYLNTGMYNTVKAQETLTATFVGLTEDYYFEFKDADNNQLIFNEISGDVDINLYEEDAVGKKYEITWEEYSTDEIGDDGEPTGESVKAKRIIAMTEVEE